MFCLFCCISEILRVLPVAADGHLTSNLLKLSEEKLYSDQCQSISGEKIYSEQCQSKRLNRLNNHLSFSYLFKAI